MKRTKDKITSFLNAITFAEAGEHDTAKQYLQDASGPVDGPVKQNHTVATAVEAQNRSLRGKVRDYMAAVAFAEAGEHEFAARVAHAVARPRSVLFVIDGDAADSNAFGYAMSLCKRMNLEMDILQVISDLADVANFELSSPRADRAAARVQALAERLEQEGIAFKTTVRRGDPNQLLYDYAQSHKDVFMVIYDSPRANEKSPEAKIWQRIVDGISRKLSIPLVTVTGRQSTPQTS